jgi:hypothetical protein
METHRLYETNFFHWLGTLEEYERLKVTALNLFHPTASPSLKSRFFHITTQSSHGGRVKGGGIGNSHRWRTGN